MMKRLLPTFTILLCSCILSRSQILNFHCDFDIKLEGDCLFTATNGGNKLTQDQGPFPTGNPKQPLSDAKSVISLTDPDNQPCNFPYKYGGTDLYFCRRFSNGTFTCPTDAGVGRCKAGKLGLIKPPTSGKIDHSYTANVTKSTSTTQCFDFYYYITDATGNAKLEVSWERNGDLDAIVTVEANPAENKWQHSRTTFTVPPSTSTYDITLRIMRDTGASGFTFAFDEIKIYDASCDSIVEPTTTIPGTATTATSSTTISDTTTTITTTPVTTTPVPDTTTTTPVTTTPVPDTTTTTPVTTTPVSDTTTTTPVTTTPVTTTPVSDTTITATTTTVITTTPMPATTTTTSTLASDTSLTTTTGIISVATSTGNPYTTTTMKSETTTTTTAATTTTTQYLRRLFYCDFSTDTCFLNTDIIVTNGTEVPLLDLSQPPRAPLSDATSVNSPTTNSYKCNLPYQLSLENSTNTTDWNMWFCYNNQCPTQNGQTADCASGNYGLMFLGPSDSNKNITTSISDESLMRSLSGDEHCLRYEYFFTVYDDADWGQQLSVWIKSVDGGEELIDRIRVDEMQENRWYERNKTFVAPSTNYTLTYSFEVSNESGNQEAVVSRTVYFGMDNIELYNRKCDEALEPVTGMTTDQVTTSITTKPTSLTSTTLNATTTTIADVTSKPNLALILPLAIGIPVLIAVVAFIVYYCVKIKSKSTILVEGSTNPVDIPLKPTTMSTSDDSKRSRPVV